MYVLGTIGFLKALTNVVVEGCESIVQAVAGIDAIFDVSIRTIERDFGTDRPGTIHTSSTLSVGHIGRLLCWTVRVRVIGVVVAKIDVVGAPLGSTDNWVVLVIIQLCKSPFGHVFIMLAGGSEALLFACRNGDEKSRVDGQYTSDLHPFEKLLCVFYAVTI